MRSSVTRSRDHSVTNHFVADTMQEPPAEASVLPASDKPVTLSFKGGLSISKPGQAGPSRKVAPLSQAFSMDDAAEDEQDAATNEAAATEDPKGLSRCWRTNICAGWLTVLSLLV